MSVLKTLSLSNLFVFDWNWELLHVRTSSQAVLLYSLKHIIWDFKRSYAFWEIKLGKSAPVCIKQVRYSLA